MLIPTIYPEWPWVPSPIELSTRDLTEPKHVWVYPGSILVYNGTSYQVEGHGIQQPFPQLSLGVFFLSDLVKPSEADIDVEVAKKLQRLASADYLDASFEVLLLLKELSSKISCLDSATEGLASSERQMRSVVHALSQPAILAKLLESRMLKFESFLCDSIWFSLGCSSYILRLHAYDYHCGENASEPFASGVHMHASPTLDAGKSFFVSKVVEGALHQKVYAVVPRRRNINGHLNGWRCNLHQPRRSVRVSNETLLQEANSFVWRNATVSECVVARDGMSYFFPPRWAHETFVWQKTVTLEFRVFGNCAYADAQRVTIVDSEDRSSPKGSLTALRRRAEEVRLQLIDHFKHVDDMHEQ